MLTKELENILRTQIAQDKPVPSTWANELLETIAALRAQVEQLQLDVQQANAATEAQTEKWENAVSMTGRAIKLVDEGGVIITNAYAEIASLHWQVATTGINLLETQMDAQRKQTTIDEMTKRDTESAIQEKVLNLALKELEAIPWRELWRNKLAVMSSPIYPWIMINCPLSARK